MAEKQVTDIVDLFELPRWALVAYAARCARRLQPLYSHDWPNAPARHIEAVDAAIEMSESAAANGIVYAAINVARYGALAAASGASEYDRSMDAAYNAIAAADAARDAAAVTADGITADAADSAFESVADSAHSAVLGLQDYPHAAGTARFDYFLLLGASRKEKWDDDTPVPPEFFGPLWPFGKPEGWPVEDLDEEEAGEQKLLLEFTVPEDATDEEVQRLVEEATQRASALHMAHGGAGLIVDDLQIHAPARQPEEAPVG